MFGLLVVAVAAAAAPLQDRPQSSYDAQLRTAALRAEAFYSLNSICNSAKITLVKTLTGPGKPPILFEQMKFVGCGRSSLTNVEMLPKAGGAWDLEFRLPGMSYGDVQLQHSALPTVLKTLTDYAPQGCRNMALGTNVSVGETSIVGDHGSIRVIAPGQKPRPTAANVRFTTTLTLNDPKQVADVDEDNAWRELWPLRACGADRSVSVTFLPHRSRAYFDVLVSPHWPGAPGFHTTAEAPR
jgi:hypothetical protein